MACQVRSGFLFAHDCDRPEVGHCTRCGRTVCALHQREELCADCALPHAAAPQPSAPEPRRVGTAASTYDAADFAAFEPAANRAMIAGGADFDADDRDALAAVETDYDDS